MEGDILGGKRDLLSRGVLMIGRREVIGGVMPIEAELADIS